MKHTYVTLAIVGLTLARLGARADAWPSYCRELDPAHVEAARAEIATLATKQGLPGDVAAKLLEADVYATSSDRGCPGIDVDVINATNHTVWNVEVKISQREGTQNHTDTVHLPYIPAKSEAAVSVDCISNYSYRSRYSSADTGITVGYEASGADTLAAALPELADHHVDYEFTGVHLAPSKTPQHQTLLEAALAMDDEAVAKELVAAIAKTKVGVKQLGAHIAGGAAGPILDEVAASLSTLAAAQQAEVAHALLGSTAAERWQAKLVPLIDGPLCGGPRPAAIALWIQAQQPDGIPIKSLRDRIGQRCAPRPSDGAAIVAAVELAPQHAGPVFDALDPKLFASVVASWRASKTEASSGQLGFLRETANAERFDLAVAAASPVALPAVIEGVAATPSTAIAAHKAQWVAAALAKVDAPARDEVVSAVFRLLVEGRMPSSEMREAVRSARALAPGAADGVLATAAAKDSKVFDAQRLKAAGVDLQEFLAFNSTALASCTESLDRLRGCSDAIARYKPPAGTSALTKLGADAIRSEFVTDARKLIDDTTDFAGLVDLAKALDAGGIAPGFVTERLCREAGHRARGDGQGDVEQVLGYAAAIEPEASCITATRDTLASKHRSAIIMTIVALLGIVLPLPASGFWMRRRWRKLAKTLPSPEIDTTAAVARLDDRLGDGGLRRALPGAIAAAQRELAGTAAGRALDAVAAPTIDRAIATLRRAVSSGDAASILVEVAQDVVYVVALPVRHPRPQVIQRYLGATWPDHLASIQRAAGRPVLALVVLCGPDIDEASLLVGHHDGRSASDPEVLLDARDARERGANRFHHVMPLAASP